MKSLVPMDYHVPRQLGDAFRNKQKENMENAIISLTMAVNYAIITPYLKLPAEVKQALRLLEDVYKDIYLE